MSSEFKEAVSLFKKGQLKNAEKICENILKNEPKNFNNLNLLGIILFQKKNYNESIRLIKKSIQISPNQSEANNNLGIIYIHLKKFKEAIFHLNNSIKVNPNFDQSYNNLGLAFMELKEFDKALQNWKKAISVNPNNAQAYNNIGNVLMEINNERSAIKHYQKAILINENFILAHFNLGNAFQKVNLLDESINSYNKAIELNIKFAEAYYNRANSYRDKNSLKKALNDYNEAYKLNPALKDLFGNIISTKNYLCDWKNYNEDIKYIEKKILNGSNIVNPFSILALIDSPSLHQINIKNFIKSEQINESNNYNFFLKNKVNSKIKLAYYSSDFRFHPVSHLLASVFENHDRSLFELYAFSLTSHKKDEMTKRIENSFDHFIDVSSKSDDEIVKLSRDLNIDIAIDLMGYTKFNRFKIFFKKCAPIQINYIGYSSTFGSNTMDYIVADKTVITDQLAKDYSEKIIYLPDTFMATDFKNIKLTKNLKRKDYNISEDAFVFCSFNKQYKINPKIFKVWMRLLKKIKKSVLWLKFTNPDAEKNIVNEAIKQSIDPNRIIFAKNKKLEDHLSRYQIADLFLDTYPYGAHTTCVDSIWAGLPVITIKGNTFVSRVSSSLLKSIGLEELITSSYKEYEDLAIFLAENPKNLISIRNKLRNNIKSKTLFNNKLYTKNLENAFKIAYKNYLDGIAKDNIEL